MTRSIDIRISAAAEKGFVIHEAGEIVAAFTSRAEVAQWIEDRLGEVDGEVERERRDIEDTTYALPRIIERTDPRWWHKLKRG